MTQTVNPQASRLTLAAAFMAVAMMTAGCDAGPDAGPDALGTTTTQECLVSSTIAGSVPAGLPSRLLVGLSEGSGATWMRDSGVPWDVRYAYFTKGWLNNYGWSPADGSWALNYFRQAAAIGAIPAVSYYQMNGEPGGGETEFYLKTQNATTMRSYFSDFKILMQRAKEFGSPVLIMLEPDGFAYMQLQGKSTTAYSAVAATGLPELAGLPNTVAGWGLAFLQIRKAVGATNVILGIHVSGWASGQDVANGDVSVALGPEVTKVHEFLKPMGLAANVTGATYDVLVGDQTDRDADYYRLTSGRTVTWWDTSDTAPINSHSFNRYAEWLRLWNVASGKRWIIWQLPLGNSNHLNVANNGGPREGYKDCRAEYYFGANSAAHLEKFANSGAIALLFGPGATGQSTHTNDIYTDGQPFMKSRAGAFLKAGGLAIPSGSGGTSPTPTPTEPTPTPTEPTPTPTPTEPAPSPTPTVPNCTTKVSAPLTVAPGSTASITASVSNIGGALTGGIVDIEVYDAAGVKSGQKFYSNVSLGTGQSASFPFAWTAPAATGSYTVKVGVFGPNWTPNYNWNAAAATIAVAAVAAPAPSPEPAPAPAPAPAPSPVPVADPAPYNFESGTQGWTASGKIIQRIGTTASPAYAGAGALAIDFSSNRRGTGHVSVASPQVPAGRTISFRIWIPANSRITSVEPFIQQGAAGGNTVTRKSYSISALTPQAWNTVTIAVPANAASLATLGVQFATSGAWTGSAYLDAVSW